MKKFILAITLILVLQSSCSVTKFMSYYASSDDKKSGDLTGEIFRTQDTSYKIGTLSDDWKRVKVKGGDLVFRNKSIDATMTVNSVCDAKKKNYTLRSLSESLLIGIQRKEIEVMEETTVDAQRAISMVQTGMLDGVPIKIATLVFIKRICVYDFTYASSPANFDIGLKDFSDFISEFRVL